MGRTVSEWLDQGQYGKVLALWVQGLELDWQRLYPDRRPRRISLPTYPFARERYWAEVASTPLHATLPHVHPVLHENVSDLQAQRYRTVFTGDEFYLRDHRVHGRPVLPAVVYLEMVRAAVDAALPRHADEQIVLTDVVWSQPLVVDHAPQSVYLELLPTGNQLDYRIYADGDEPLVYSQGRVELREKSPTDTVDLVGLQARMRAEPMDGSTLYPQLQALGLDYGPAHQGIEQLLLGNGEVLAKLRLPDSVRAHRQDYGLHPSLLDAALQAMIGLGRGDEQSAVGLPFALGRLDVLQPLPDTLWAWVRPVAEAQHSDKVDIDLFDEHGQRCVLLRNFSSRLIRPAAAQKRTPAQIISNNELHLLSPVWNTLSPQRRQAETEGDEPCLVVNATPRQQQLIAQHFPKADYLQLKANQLAEQITEILQSMDEFEHIIWVAPEAAPLSLADDSLIDAQNEGVILLFRFLKALFKLDYGIRDLSWTVITFQTQAVRSGESVNPSHASIHGLVGSLAKEYPHWSIRLLDLELACEWPLENMFEFDFNKSGDALVYRGKEWFEQSLIDYRASCDAPSLYRHQGVYVVVGGAGGIGEVWSRWMLDHYQAQIIWIGRRTLDDSIGQKLEALNASVSAGSGVRYIQADAGDRQALESALVEIKKHHQSIDGLVHSAIILNDHSLAKMDEKQFRETLAAKVDVSVRLAQVFGAEKLDFVLFFSSLIAYNKAPGQSNYAAGCTFKDAFARQLARDWSCAAKIINWGWWGSVGIVNDAQYQQRMQQAGIASIEAQDGMDALQVLLQSPVGQMALIKYAAPTVQEISR